MAEECIENDYEMCLNEIEILQSHAAQPVRQRSNIEYQSRTVRGLCKDKFSGKIGTFSLKNRCENLLKGALDRLVQSI